MGVQYKKTWRKDWRDDRYEQEFKREAKEHLEELVAATTPAVPRYRHYYICPCCNSGTGNNRHFTPGFNVFRGRTGEMKFKCQACGVSGDIFEFVKLTRPGAQHYPEQKKIVADFLNLDIEHRQPVAALASRPKSALVSFAPPLTKEEIADLKKKAHDYIVESRKHIEKTDYFQKRGFTQGTIDAFRLGFDPKKKAAVIPFNGCYYVTRNTQVGANMKGERKHYKPKGLEQPLFNPGAMGTTANPDRMPVFVVEAPIDAMSIEQAGGKALAVGGTSSSLLCRYIKDFRPDLTFILAFDNDNGGRRAEANLIEGFKEVEEYFREVSGGATEYKVSYIPLDGEGAFGRYKDANEILMKDPAALQESVAAAVEKALAHEKTADERGPAPSGENISSRGKHQGAKESIRGIAEMAEAAEGFFADAEAMRASAASVSRDETLVER